MTTGARTLELLSLLQGRRSWGGAELASRLEVSLRTLRRDVDRLRELGYPVQARRGTDGGYQLAPGAVLPPLVLDDDEAVALAVGLQTATTTAVAGTADASLRALTKVVQVMPVRLRRRLDALQAVTDTAQWGDDQSLVDPVRLTSVAQACRDQERLELDHVSRVGTRTTRTVEPHRLVCLGRRWYLVAYDLSRHDWRTFRLDRVVEVRPARVRFRLRELPAEDAAAFVRRSLRDLPAAYEVRAVVHAPSGDVRTRLGRWAEVGELDAERCTVHITADNADWLAAALGLLGAEISDVSPPEVLEHLQTWAARFTRATPAP